MTTHATDSSIILDVADGYTLVDFWAPRCAPCLAVAPVLEEISAAYAGRVKVAKLDVDDNPDTATAFNVRSVPTLVLFKEGEPIASFIGAQPKRALVRLLDEHVA